MRVLILVLEGLVGTSLIAFVYQGIRWLVLQRRPQLTGFYVHTCAALAVVCILMFVSLALSALGLATHAVGYDIFLAVVVALLLRAGAPWRPARLVMIPMPKPSSALFLAIVVAVFCGAIALSWQSGSVARRPVTAIAARSIDGKVEIEVVRGYQDERSFILQIVRDDGSVWTRRLFGDDDVRLYVDLRDVGDPRVATVQLMVGSYVVRSTEIED